MAIEWDLFEAADYIRLNTLDNEDFLDADMDRQTAVLNVSQRTIDRKFSDYEIPMEAYYLFASVLAAKFNDTNKLAQQGVSSFAISGISFTFDGKGGQSLESLIPIEVYDIIGAPRSGASGSRVVKWTVL